MASGFIRGDRTLEVSISIQPIQVSGISIAIYIGYTGTLSEWSTHARHTAADGDGGKVDTMLECIIVYRRHTVRNSERGKAAVSECIISNTRHAVGEGDGGKRIAIIERIISNVCHTATNGDRRQIIEITERPISNARHTFINHNRCDDIFERIPRIIRQILLYLWTKPL